MLGKFKLSNFIEGRTVGIAEEDIQITDHEAALSKREAAEQAEEIRNGLTGSSREAVQTGFGALMNSVRGMFNKVSDNLGGFASSESDLLARVDADEAQKSALAELKANEVDSLQWGGLKASFNMFAEKATRWASNLMEDAKTTLAPKKPEGVMDFMRRQARPIALTAGLALFGGAGAAMAAPNSDVQVKKAAWMQDFEVEKGDAIPEVKLGGETATTVEQVVTMENLLKELVPDSETHDTAWKKGNSPMNWIGDLVRNAAGKLGHDISNEEAQVLLHRTVRALNAADDDAAVKVTQGSGMQFVYDQLTSANPGTFRGAKADRYFFSRGADGSVTYSDDLRQVVAIAAVQVNGDSVMTKPGAIKAQLLAARKAAPKAQDVVADKGGDTGAGAEGERRVVSKVAAKAPVVKPAPKPVKKAAGREGAEERETVTVIIDGQEVEVDKAAEDARAQKDAEDAERLKKPIGELDQVEKDMAALEQELDEANQERLRRRVEDDFNYADEMKKRGLNPVPVHTEGPNAGAQIVNGEVKPDSELRFTWKPKGREHYARVPRPSEIEAACGDNPEMCQALMEKRTALVEELESRRVLKALITDAFKSLRSDQGQMPTTLGDTPPAER